MSSNNLTRNQQTRSSNRRGRGNGGGNSSNNNQRNKASRNLLRKFSCPYREEGTCLHDQNPQRCKFGHPETAPNRQPDRLIELPHFVCFHNLNGHCKMETSQVRNSSKLGCRSGLHLEVHEFAENPEQFEQQNRELIKNFFGTDIDLECAICLEKVLGKRFARNRRFGILEHCNHIFCATCLIAWHQNSKSCPMCRVESRRYVVRAKFVQTPYEKMAIFSMTNNNNNNSNLTTRPSAPSVPNSTIPATIRQTALRVPTTSSSTVSTTTTTTLEHTLECRICSEKVMSKLLVRKHQFAILERCDHIFCSYCVIQLRTDPFRCPECRLESRNFIITQRWFGSGNLEMKRQLFYSARHNPRSSSSLLAPATVRFYSFNESLSRGPNGLADYLDDDWFYYVDQLRNRPSFSRNTAISSSAMFHRNVSSTPLPRPSIQLNATNQYVYAPSVASQSFSSLPSSPLSPFSAVTSTHSYGRRKSSKDKNCSIV